MTDLKNYQNLLNFFEKSKKEIIAFDLNQTVNDNPYVSKVGGTPYMPIGSHYPTIKNYYKPESNEQLNLTFIYQFNLSELYEQVGQTLFPNKGMLQIFVMPDFWYGEGIEFPINELCKIVYYPEITEHNKINKIGVDTKYSKEFDTDLLMNIFDVSFRKNTHYLSPSDILSTQQLLGNEKLNNDYAYNSLIHHFDCYINLDKKEKDYEAKREILNYIEEKGSDILYEDSHFFFGYGHFQQSDNLEITEDILEKEYICLLQSSPSDEICDVSINFRIPKKDLENMNFENVIFNMDCT